MAANCVLSTFGIGILGPGTFYLGLGDSMVSKEDQDGRVALADSFPSALLQLIILFINAFGAILPSYLACFGPNLGLRQVSQESQFKICL